ncbi:hypothetical protein AYO38_00345 [bacterium SCGC AG-212-C10]|nr:hypothetical protein AYO38_00345 [bacterium SCGC AG-212-C10]
MSTTPTRETDIAIVGGGGAGLTAALYSARGRRKTLVFERAVTGGQISTTDIVENFPGFPKGINGFDLAQNFLQQAEHFGAEMVYEAVTAIRQEPDSTFTLTTADGDVHAKAVIVTAGADYNHLGVPGEERLVGRGVSYCATCDAAFFQGKDAIVVGGGDAAIDEGLFASRYTRSISVVHRRDKLRANASLQERAFTNPKFKFIWNSEVQAILGGEQVTGIVLKDTQTGAGSELPTDAVFIFIGQTPNSSLLDGLVPLDPRGHAIVDLKMQTPVRGLFVAGDLRAEAARQLISACGDGATAAISAEHYLSEHFGPPTGEQ